MCLIYILSVKSLNRVGHLYTFTTNCVSEVVCAKILYFYTKYMVLANPFINDGDAWSRWCIVTALSLHCRVPHTC